MGGKALWLVVCRPLHLVLILLIFLPRPVSSQVVSGAEPPVAKQADWSGQPKYRPDEILVRFRSGTSSAARKTVHEALGGLPLKSWSSIDGLQLVRLAAGTSIRDAIRAYRQNRNVLYAEPNYIYHALTTPNDPKFSQLWGLQNTGQNLGTVGADIHASQAWGLTTGSSSVVVAVIDTGIDYNHEDLRANVWSNPSAYSATIDGVSINCSAGTHGFNVFATTCDPLDDNGHGTHVSGTIGAVGNNGIGVAGINWSVQILACKFLDASGGGSLSDALTCLDFVKAMKDRGANIVATNNSWGGGGFSQALSDAIQAQQKDGILFIAAAGNDSSNNDLVPTYPSDYFLPNVISVAATTRFDGLANFSSTGAHSVHLGAPGQEILSTTPNNTYSVFSGTSMATPHVTGVAALLAAQNPSRDWRAIKNLIVAGGDTIAALAATVSGKRLNAYGAMTCSNSTVAKRLQPTLDTIAGAVGQPITLAALNINCAQPVGPVTVTVAPGNQQIILSDGGVAPDQAAGDGIYSGTWTPSALGDYVLSFSTGDVLQVTVLSNYTLGGTPYNYQTITGTNLNLGDDELATVSAPFPVQFGGASFRQLYVSSNGTISFTNVFDDFLNFDLPVNTFLNGNPQNSPPPVPLQPIVTLVAPLWQDLYPVKGTNQNVFWAVTGAVPNRQLVVEWRNVRTFDCRTDSTANVTFEVVFSESSSNVVFNYANTQFGGACSNQDFGQAATIGIQVTQNLGVQWGADQTSIDTGISLMGTLVPSNPTPNPAPTVSSVSPASIPTGSGDTWLTLTGANFLPSSQASFYPYVLAVTEYVSATQLKILLPAADLVYPSGTPGIQINVTNPPPGGGTSFAVYVTVVGQNSPQITSISPTSVPAGSFGFILTINGSGFVPYATDVLFNGNGGLTTFVSPNQLTFGVTGAMVQTAGAVPVQVQVGPTTFTNTVTFTITPATSPAVLSAPLPATSSALPWQPEKPKFVPRALPGRFEGWKAARFLGPDYLKQFRRSHGGIASPAPNFLKPTGVPNGRLAQSGSTAPPIPAGFNFRPTLPTDFIPTAVVTGDFNGDGKMDWVVANGGSNTLWIYLGKGDGTTQLPVILPLTGLAPTALAAVDINHDGKLDLVVTEADSGSVGVLLGNGDGTFGPELSFTVPSLPVSLAVADFNGDGNLDVVVGMIGTADTGQLAFLPGDGTGRLGAPVTHYGQASGVFNTMTIASADLDGDGLPDIVALDLTYSADGLLLSEQFSNAGARVYLNQGNGIFKLSQQFFFDRTVDQAPEFGDVVLGVALGDVNKDGCIDAVTVDLTGTATFFPGLCNGTFDTANQRIFGTGIIAGAATLADVNGDGALDLISSAQTFADDALYPSSNDSSVSVMFGDGTGNFGVPTLFRGEPDMFAIAVADLNGDHLPEIITANEGTDTLSVYQNDGHGGFGGPTGGYLGYLSGGQMHAVGNAPITNFSYVDVNGDGHKDLITVESGQQYPFPSQLTVLLGDGTGRFGSPIRTPILDVNTQLNDFLFGDFTNTGRKDLIIFGITTPIPSLGPFYAYCKSNGDGTFQKPVVTAFPGIYPLLYMTADLNHDGKLDFLVVTYGAAASGSGTVASIVPFLGNGDGTFSPGTAQNFPSGSGLAPFIQATVVADVNGDGKLDLLVFGDQIISAGEQNAIYEFIGNGDGTFQPPKLLFNNLGPFGVADLNGDGRPDIIAAVDTGYLPGILGHEWLYEVFLGNSDGSFTAGSVYGPYPNPYAAGYLYPPADHTLGSPQPVIGDFNGDGKPDLAVFVTAGSDVFNEIGYAGGPLYSAVIILAGNGDGTLSPSNLSYGLGSLVVPQTAADTNGDNRTDLIEMNGITSSYSLLKATAGPAFDVALVSDPVIGANGKLRVTLAYPSPNGTTLQLSASDPNISIPASVAIAAGSRSQDVGFLIGGSFNPSHVFGLTAQSGSESHTAYGTQVLNSQSTGFAMVLQLTTTPVVLAGQSTPDYGLLVGSIGGYGTQITPSCLGLPAGASCQFGQNPIPLPVGNTVAVSLVVATQPSIALGQYSFTVTLTDGSITQSAPASFNVGDFSMSITPASQTIGATDFTAFTLNIPSINGYSQGVQLTCSGLPSGTACPFGNTPYGPGSQGNYFQIHTQNAIPGTYNFTITGTSGSVVHSASAQLIVTTGTFSGSISPTSATISVGGSQNFNMQVNSLNNFQGPVSLSCVNPPNGISCQFGTNPVSVTPNVASTSILTLSVASKPASTLPLRFGPPWIPPYLLRILQATRLLLVSLALAVVLAIISRQRRILVSLRIRPVALWTIGILLLVAVGLAACGGGSSIGGGGGGGGGSVPVTVKIAVQGTAGNTNTILGSLTITVP